MEEEGKANAGSAPQENTDDSKPVAPEAQDIGEAKAKSIALAHAGASETEVTRLSTYKEYDDGIWEYHVQFYLGYTEYEYEILAVDGSILDFEKDADD